MKIYISGLDVVVDLVISLSQTFYRMCQWKNCEYRSILLAKILWTKICGLLFSPTLYICRLLL